MTTFLFWNLKKKPLYSAVASLARRHECDVLVLAECELDPMNLLQELNPLGESTYHFVASQGCRKIEIYCRFQAKFIPSIRESHRTTIRRLELPGHLPILLAATHFPSKRNWDEASQAAESAILSELVKDAENAAGHSRTVLVGDLNMNPFDAGIVNANGMHGVMTRSIAAKEERTVQGQAYPFFYNPMWGFLGDASPGPPGTHYYPSSAHRVYFWNMFDQVLVRPGLLDRFSTRNLRILESDGSARLVTADGVPDDKVASDHLPILFSLELEARHGD